MTEKSQAVQRSPFAVKSLDWHPADHWDTLDAKTPIGVYSIRGKEPWVFIWLDERRMGDLPGGGSTTYKTVHEAKDAAQTMHDERAREVMGELVSPAPSRPETVDGLTKHETDFCLLVFRSPGGKLDGHNDAGHWEDDGTEDGRMVSHWTTPEAMGLVESVGSYKWVPTEKLEALLRAGLAARSPVLSPATDAPPCWWIDHGTHGQITQREDEAKAAVAEGKPVVRYLAASETFPVSAHEPKAAGYVKPSPAGDWYSWKTCAISDPGARPFYFEPPSALSASQAKDWADLRVLVENAAFHEIDDPQANMVAASEIIERLGPHNPRSETIATHSTENSANA